MDNKSGNKRRGHMKFILDKHVKGREAENLAQIYFLKNGYHVFSNVSQQGCIDMVVVNKDNEIIAIKIKLEDDKGNESNTSLSSSNPISTITLGAKDDSLYIISSNSKSFSFNGTHSLSKHFDFSFDDDEHVMTINGKTFDFDDIKEQLKDAFVFENDEDGKRMILKLNNFDFDFDEGYEDDHEKHERKEKKVWISKI